MITPHVTINHPISGAKQLAHNPREDTTEPTIIVWRCPNLSPATLANGTEQTNSKFNKDEMFITIKKYINTGNTKETYYIKITILYNRNTA